MKEEKEENEKVHYIVPVSFSEETGKEKFVFIDFDWLGDHDRTVYIDSYKKAIKDAKLLSEHLKQDVAVVELKEVIKFRAKNTKVKKLEE